MSDSTTVAIDRDDLVELIALALAANEVGEFFNGRVHPSPGWERHAYEAWRIREKYLEDGSIDRDDDDARNSQPAVVKTEALADELAADTLQAMLADEDEYAGLARFFDKEPWTGHVTWPIPFHRLRQDMRAHADLLRERSSAQLERGTIDA